MKRTFLFYLLAIGLAFAVPIDAKAGTKMGDPVDPALTVKTLDGKEVKLVEMLKGKPTLLVFFNTVCKNCVTELRDVNKVYNNSASSKVNVYGVGVDMGGEKVLAAFQKAEQLNYPILADPDFAVGAAFGFGFTPATVFIDAEGKLKDISTGYSADSKGKIADFIK